MSVAPGTPLRLIGPKASVNPNDPRDCPIIPEGTVGVYAGPLEGAHEWHLLVVSYEVAVRFDPSDVEPVLDAEGDGDIDDTPARRPVDLDEEAE